MRKSVLDLQSWYLTPGGEICWMFLQGCCKPGVAHTPPPAWVLATEPALSEEKAEDKRAEEAYSPESQLHTEHWNLNIMVKGKLRSPPSPAARSMGNLLRLLVTRRPVQIDALQAASSNVKFVYHFCGVTTLPPLWSVYLTLSRTGDTPSYIMSNSSWSPQEGENKTSALQMRLKPLLSEGVILLYLSL